jgi:hypothetical protein
MIILYSCTKYSGVFKIFQSIAGKPTLPIIRRLIKYLPVLVETAAAILAQMLGKDSLQRSGTTRSVDVSNNTNNDHRRSFKDGDGLNNFLLVDLGSRLVHVANDVGHASLVTHEGSQVDRLGRIVLWESLDFAARSARALLRSEAHRTVARRRKFSVRHNNL